MRATDRPHASPWLLWTAEHQAALADQLERASLPKSRSVWIEHRAYVLSSIVTAAAFVEAFVNELYQDVEDRASGQMHPADWLHRVTEPLSPEAMETMQAFWKRGGAHRPTIEKYERFVESCGAELDGQSHDDVRLLIRLRNDVLHYRPRDHFRAKAARYFETELKKRGIGANPLAEGDRRAYWTERALSGQLAIWCTRAAVTLTDQVSAAACLVPAYVQHKRGGWYDAPPGSHAFSE